MAKFKIALAAALAVAFGVPSALPQGTVPGRFVVPLGYCQITSLASATPLKTANCAVGSVPAGATMVAIRVEGAAIRYRDDVAAPTATVGQPMLTSDPPILHTGRLGSLQFIQQSSSATLDVLFYR
jgi:hypothetical protein